MVRDPNEVIRVFVGTDARQGPAERALRNSIIRNTEATPGGVDVRWMRAGGSEALWNGWNIGREPERPKTRGWGTDFAGFRFCVPELAGFTGRAIYLDSDMIALGDLHELLTLPMTAPVLCTSVSIMDVMVIDCGAFQGLDWWPSIEEMKPSGTHPSVYRGLLKRNRFLDTSLPPEWNCRDRVPKGCKLLHFTNIRTQPWRPYEDVDCVDHRDHTDADSMRLWEEYAGR